MAQQVGKWESFESKTAKSGNPYGRAVIDGRPVVVFSGMVERARAMPLGSQVEYRTAPTPDGKGESLVWLTALGAQTAATQSTTQTGATSAPARGFDGNRQERIEFQSMVKIAADKLLAHPATAEMPDEQFRDELFKTGHDMYRQFLAEVAKVGAGNPTK